MLPLYSLDELRIIEARHADLMGRAGYAAARWIAERFSKRSRILLLAGPGNNGGDAFATGAALRELGFDPALCYCGPLEAPLSQDAQNAFDAWESSGGITETDLPEGGFDLIVDGLFGIGLNRAIDGFAGEIIDWANQEECPILALDVPSGLNAFTGVCTGPAINADWTLSFISFKAGLLTGQHAERCGQIFLHALELDDQLPDALGHTLSLDDVRDLLPRRSRSSHKGLNGNVGIIGGSAGMVGAALLAGRAALYSGAGRVYIGLLDESLSVDPTQPELMLRRAADVFALNHLNCLVIGPGLGEGSAAMQALDWGLRCPLPLVLDADALNLIARFPVMKEMIQRRSGLTLLTPHPAEAGRLLHVSTQEIELDRVGAARRIAAEYDAAVVLKGSGSVLAFADGEFLINTTGNPGMASAGQGDVLSGLIGALIAQGLGEGDALLAGVCVHGAAADRLVAEGYGPVGLTASECITAIRSVLNSVG